MFNLEVNKNKLKTMQHALEAHEKQLNNDLKMRLGNEEDKEDILDELLNTRDLLALVWESRVGFRTNKGL